MSNLKELKDTIESLSVQQQITIGKLFYENKIKMFENKNGVFINLTEISDSVLETINIHLAHVKEQEKSFTDLENKKQAYKDNFFTNVNEVYE